MQLRQLRPLMDQINEIGRNHTTEQVG